MNTPGHLYLWAKQRGLDEPYPLICHLLDTATTATILWDRWLRSGLKELLGKELGPRAGEIVAYACALHDIGKANPVFAGQLGSRRQEKWMETVRDLLKKEGFEFSPQLHCILRWQDIQTLYRHEQASALALAVGDLTRMTPVGPEWISLTALGHHGHFDSSWDKDDLDIFSSATKGKWQKTWADLRDLVAQALDISHADLPRSLSPVAIVLLSGLAVLADRVSSTDLSVAPGYKLLTSKGIDVSNPASWIEERREHLTQAISKTVGFYDDFSDPHTAILGSYHPNDLQAHTAEPHDGLWIVMAPTGYGKTEAALLRHALAPERLLFMLPTQATSNALMRRLYKNFSTTSNVAALAHSLASLEDFYAQQIDVASKAGPRGLYPTEFVSAGSARLLAPVCIGTIDQALMGALPLKWTHLRLLALANSHVVIDEAHTMEHYQSTLIEPLFNWWGATQTRVTVLTATLPTWQRDLFLNAYKYGEERGKPQAESLLPISPQFPATVSLASGTVAVRPLSSPSYKIRITTRSTEDVLSEHLAWNTSWRDKAPRARLGIIVNTIDRAQTLASCLIDQGEHVLVLHSRMTAEHRRQVGQALETDLGNTGKAERITVIGTQAIEASLDIDLDAMSTDLAPAPSLIQRAGRVWRRVDPRRTTEDGRIPGVDCLPLHIVRGESPIASLPYFGAELSRTWKYLENRQELIMPGDSQNFIEASAITSDVDFQATTAEIEAAYQELGHVSLKLGDAKHIRNRLDLTVHDHFSIGHLSRLTTMYDSDSTILTTRFIDRRSRRIVLLGEGVGTWEGTVADLNTLHPTDRENLHRATRATLSLSGKMLRRAEKVGVPLEPRAGSLYGHLALKLGDEFYYDNFLGLMVR